MEFFENTITSISETPAPIFLLVIIVVLVFIAIAIQIVISIINTYMGWNLQNSNKILEESKKQTRLLERLIEIIEEPERRQETDQLVGNLIDKISDALGLDDEQKK